MALSSRRFSSQAGPISGTDAGRSWGNRSEIDSSSTQISTMNFKNLIHDVLRIPLFLFLPGQKSWSVPGFHVQVVNKLKVAF